ncbi:hypothetical protein [Sphaerimonospora mesophila]|uniref:hypothetical protein n=1 Tax=Sphaerimonospora mesophila TaxID=37483 RepID=UPI0006E40B6E
MNQIDRVAPRLPAPTRIGQATAVEQSRAVAEVHAAIVVAQQCPRDIQAARAAMQDSCAQKFLAERAFYRYNRAGKNITGPTVHLARELARCFGNVQYGVSEMRRDDEYGQSEMQAWAWDVERNTRSSLNFIVPHARDTSDGATALTSARDIYENNANAGARRLREVIFAILPPWFVEEAKELCNKTLAGGGEGKTLPQVITDVIEGYAGIGVSPDQLEQKLGRSKDEWNGYDVAQLRVIWRSIRRREVTIEEEFPQPRVTVEEITKPQKPAAEGTEKVSEPEEGSEPEPSESDPLHYSEEEISETGGDS